MEELLFNFGSTTKVAISESSPRKQCSKLHNSGSIESMSCNSRQMRLETISEVPMDETPEETCLENCNEADSPEGDSFAQLESGDDSLVSTNAGKAKADLVAPELTSDPLTPDD